MFEEEKKTTTAIMVLEQLKYSFNQTKENKLIEDIIFIHFETQYPRSHYITILMLPLANATVNDYIYIIYKKTYFTWSRSVFGDSSPITIHISQTEWLYRIFIIHT